MPAASYAFSAGIKRFTCTAIGASAAIKRERSCWRRCSEVPGAFQEVTADRLKDERHIVELSGGLDSAAVTAAAVAGGRKEQLLAVNISFAEPDMILSHDRDLVKNMMRDMDIPA
ncbi:hypothetical protein PO124_04770 [Bacillus licheniformis]|nr:hypothetical protein [Bacillus licheniformis]